MFGRDQLIYLSKQIFGIFELACCILNVWWDSLWQSTSDNLLHSYSPLMKKKRHHRCSRHVIFCVIISCRSEQPLSFVMVIDGVAILRFFFLCVCTTRGLYSATFPNKVILPIHCINSGSEPACKWNRTLWSHFLKTTPTTSRHLKYIIDPFLHVLFYYHHYTTI